MAHEARWASTTIAFIWAATAVVCILAPDLVIEDGGPVPIAAIISPTRAVLATKYVVDWVKRTWLTMTSPVSYASPQAMRPEA